MTSGTWLAVDGLGDDLLQQPPGRPVGHHFGLRCPDTGLLWGIVAYYVGLIDLACQAPTLCQANMEPDKGSIVEAVLLKGPLFRFHVTLGSVVVQPLGTLFVTESPQAARLSVRQFWNRICRGPQYPRKLPHTQATYALMHSPTSWSQIPNRAVVSCTSNMSETEFCNYDLYIGQLAEVVQANGTRFWSCYHVW